MFQYWLGNITSCSNRLCEVQSNILLAIRKNESVRSFGNGGLTMIILATRSHLILSYMSFTMLRLFLRISFQDAKIDNQIQPQTEDSTTKYAYRWLAFLRQPSDMNREILKGTNHGSSPRRLPIHLFTFVKTTMCPALRYRRVHQQYPAWSFWH